MNTGPGPAGEGAAMPSPTRCGFAPLLLGRMRGHRGLEGQVFQAMVEGWEADQRRQGRARATIQSRLLVVRRFLEFCDHYPWRWRMADIDDWTVTLLSAPRPLAPSTMRAYQRTLGMFCTYLRDGDSNWAVVCEECFGVPLPRICQQWNAIATAAPSRAGPGNHVPSRQELESFFDDADDQMIDAPVQQEMSGGVL